MGFLETIVMRIDILSKALYGHRMWAKYDSCHDRDCLASSSAEVVMFQGAVLILLVFIVLFHSQG